MAVVLRLTVRMRFLPQNLGRLAQTPSIQDDRFRYRWKIATGEHRGK